MSKIWTPASGEKVPVALCNVVVPVDKAWDAKTRALKVALCGREATHSFKLTCKHGHDKDGWACDRHNTTDEITFQGMAVCPECRALDHICRVTVAHIERYEQ